MTEVVSSRIDVLIADRDHMAGQLMASALKGCRNQFDVVVVATNSEAAIENLEIHKPHVALVSPELADGSQTGFKVLQTLRASHPETAGIMMLHSIVRDSWASTQELDYILDGLTRLKPVQISSNGGMAQLTPSE
ncbi:MAG: hypothetical protein WA715_05365 [Candidatus Acidiferrum sp.]